MAKVIIALLHSRIFLRFPAFDLIIFLSVALLLFSRKEKNEKNLRPKIKED